MQSYAATIDSIHKAREVISPYAVVTPVLTSPDLDKSSGLNLFFKCESLQRGGAFKFRGACNAVFSLDDDVAQKGVITHSSGNHGGALALAAKLRGIAAYVIVPSTAPKSKVDKIRREGGEVVYSERPIETRVAMCEKKQRETNAIFISPYNYGPVISGQGTVGLEILEQIHNGLDAIVVPVSGGGLLSGVLIAVKSLKPEIKVIAAEPTGENDSADVEKSLAAGELIDCPFPKTIADGLMGKLGSLTWPIIRDLVDGIVTVSEEEILTATRLCHENLKIVVEPSGATSLAAVLSPKFKSLKAVHACSKVCLILSGGNLDLNQRGLWERHNWKPE